jgi:hypothetical protein
MLTPNALSSQFATLGKSGALAFGKEQLQPILLHG